MIVCMSGIQMPEDFYEQSPTGNVLATEVVMNAVRTADILLDRIGRVLRPLGVSQAGGLVLGLLRDHGAMPPSELGERLIVSRATVTGLLDSLERKGLVRRDPHGEDRRRLIVSITEEGLRVLAELRPLVHENEKRWLSGLTDDELRRLLEMLHRAQASLDANR
jgi:MarR family 2-MHQ and catechol resistance regulon transcriptional repressor